MLCYIDDVISIFDDKTSKIKYIKSKVKLKRDKLE